MPPTFASAYDYDKVALLTRRLLLPPQPEGFLKI
jgi:hypothetical protein